MCFSGGSELTILDLTDLYRLFGWGLPIGYLLASISWVFGYVVSFLISLFKK